MILKKTSSTVLMSFMLIICIHTNTMAQDLSKYEALFISKFMDYVVWPDGNENLVIGVVGNSKVLTELQSMPKLKSKNVKIRKLSNAGQAAGCNIVFIPTSQSKQFRSIQSSTLGKNILIVCENEELAKKGSVITFFSESGKLRFIVNEGAAESRGLKVSSSLLRIAKVI